LDSLGKLTLTVEPSTVGAVDGSKGLVVHKAAGVRAVVTGEVERLAVGDLTVAGHLVDVLLGQAEQAVAVALTDGVDASGLERSQEVLERLGRVGVVDRG
jgi:hypothetical protein